MGIQIPQENGTTITVSTSGKGIVSSAPSTPAPDPAPTVEEELKVVAAEQGEYSLEEVKKHNTEDDCWVVVDGDVLDVTNFLSDHPGKNGHHDFCWQGRH